MSNEAERKLGEWIAKTLKKVGIDIESEVEKEERRERERQAEREQRNYERELKRQEARWRAEERRKKLEERQHREQALLLEKREESLHFLSEHFGISSFERVLQYVHPRQQIFLAAHDQTMQLYKDKLREWHDKAGDIFSGDWTIDIPLRNLTGEYYLVSRIEDLLTKEPYKFKILKEYDGEPLNPRMGHSATPPIEWRKAALNSLNQLYREPGELDHTPMDPPFAPRHLKTMKCMYEHPGITTQEIAKMQDWKSETPKRWKKEIKRLAQEHLPSHPDFTLPKGNNKYVHADVVPPYWWQQGFCFETV